MVSLNWNNPITTPSGDCLIYIEKMLLPDKHGHTRLVFNKTTQMYGMFYDDGTDRHSQIFRTKEETADDLAPSLNRIINVPNHIDNIGGELVEMRPSFA
jgi:hypothetical protein